MKNISHSVGMLINKIVVYGVLRNLEKLKRGHYIQKKSLFEPKSSKVWLDLFLRKRRWNDCQRQFDVLWSYDKRLLLPVTEEYDLEIMWFQQDGATCHSTRTNMASWQAIFPGH